MSDSKLFACLLLELVDEGKIDKDRLIDYLLLNMNDQQVLEVIQQNHLTELFEESCLMT
jgi:hypothetical protein